MAQARNLRLLNSIIDNNCRLLWTECEAFHVRAMVLGSAAKKTLVAKVRFYNFRELLRKFVTAFFCRLSS